MKTKKGVLERYENEDSVYIIQISTNNFRDLFNEFDRTASFIKRDLNYDFAEYLIDSAEDLDGCDFILSLHLHSENKSIELENKVNKGIDNYFEYETHIIEKKKTQIQKRVFLHILLATICFFVSFSLNKIINTDSFLHMLFVESTLIAAWVLMWPVFSDFIYKLLSFKKKIKLYKKLINAELKFTYLQ